MDWCATEFQLAQVVHGAVEGDKSNLRAYLAKVPFEQLEPKHQELMRPREAPGRFQYLLDAFQEMSNRREPAMSGIAPITFGMIKDWGLVYRKELRDWEIDCLLRVDNAYRKANAPKPSKARQEIRKENRNGR